MLNRRNVNLPVEAQTGQVHVGPKFSVGRTNWSAAFGMIPLLMAYKVTDISSPSRDGR
jgi:hypothetical protein